MFHCAYTIINYQLPSKLKDTVFTTQSNQSYGIQWLTLNQDLSAYVVRICLLRISHCNPRFEMVNGAFGSCERHLINCCFLLGTVSPNSCAKSPLVCFKVPCCVVVQVDLVQTPYHSHHATATIPQLNAGGYFSLMPKSFPRWYVSEIQFLVVLKGWLVSSGREYDYVSPIVLGQYWNILPIYLLNIHIDMS